MMVLIGLFTVFSKMGDSSRPVVGAITRDGIAKRLILVTWL